ncbi:hypothetical protein [Paenibacillus alvei]|uniref:hypothetical protein n=1 Tax=Paenibacillus alvei TaxID=44250 RepID=UPI00227F18A9|nr:hypothetical protein [Paenibacillus alvei]
MKNVKELVLKASANVYSKAQRFMKEERGDAMKWVVGIFFGVLLMIVVYSLLKTEIDTFVKDKIFGKMNSLS